MKLSVELIESRIVDENYIFVKDLFQDKEDLHRLTICLLTLDNGFVVTGESSCVDAKNFNEELGKKFAREAAFKKLWDLLGFELRTKLTQGKLYEFTPDMSDKLKAALLNQVLEIDYNHLNMNYHEGEKWYLDVDYSDPGLTEEDIRKINEAHSK